MSGWEVLVPIATLLATARAIMTWGRFNTQCREKNYTGSQVIGLGTVIGLSLPGIFLVACFQLVFDIMAVFPPYNKTPIGMQIWGHYLQVTDKSVLFVSIVLLAVAMLSLAVIESKSSLRAMFVGKLKTPSWLNVLFVLYWASIPGSLMLIYWISGGKFWRWWGDHDYLITPYLMYYGIIVVFIRIKKAFQAQRDITELVDRTALVLYLRSFYLDHIPFATARYKEKEFGELINGLYDGKSSPSMSFEAYFGFQVKLRLGNLVTVGRPSAMMPNEMTNTVFLRDEQWQQEVSSLIVDAKIILLQLGETHYVKEELLTIIEAGAVDKMYIFTQPASAYRNGVPKKNMFLSPKDYKRFAGRELKEFLTVIGIQMDFVPGPGSVIGFSKGNEAILIRTGCKLPSTYIAAVAAHHQFPTYGGLQVVK